jgi:hypothetical protein
LPAGLPFSILRINRTQSLFQTNKNKKMKKILLVLAIGTFIVSCNEAADKAAETTNAATEAVDKVADSIKAAVTDTTKPVVADTTKAVPAADTTKNKKK